MAKNEPDLSAVIFGDIQARRISALKKAKNLPAKQLMAGSTPIRKTYSSKVV